MDRLTDPPLPPLCTGQDPLCAVQDPGEGDHHPDEGGGEKTPAHPTLCEEGDVKNTDSVLHNHQLLPQDHLLHQPPALHGGVPLAQQVPDQQAQVRAGPDSVLHNHQLLPQDHLLHQPHGGEEGVVLDQVVQQGGDGNKADGLHGERPDIGSDTGGRAVHSGGPGHGAANPGGMTPGCESLVSSPGYERPVPHVHDSHVLEEDEHHDYLDSGLEQIPLPPHHPDNPNKTYYLKNEKIKIKNDRECTASLRKYFTIKPLIDLQPLPTPIPTFPPVVTASSISLFGAFDASRVSFTSVSSLPTPRRALDWSRLDYPLVVSTSWYQEGRWRRSSRRQELNYNLFFCNSNG